MGAKKGAKKGSGKAPPSRPLAVVPSHPKMGGGAPKEDGFPPPSMKQRLAQAKAAGVAEAVAVSATSSGLAFMPSGKFSGPRPGYLFKKGPLGLGYYRDQMPLSTKAKAAGSSSHHAAKATAGKQLADGAAFSKKAAAQILRSKAPIISAAGGLSAKRKAEWSDDDDDDHEPSGHGRPKGKGGKAVAGNGVKSKALPGRLRKRLARDANR